MSMDISLVHSPNLVVFAREILSLLCCSILLLSLCCVVCSMIRPLRVSLLFHIQVFLLLVIYESVMPLSLFFSEPRYLSN
ncbi:hypothetical protein BDF14DRAFT_1781598, partial [Spinellus fusiger]